MRRKHETIFGVFVAESVELLNHARRPWHSRIPLLQHALHAQLCSSLEDLIDACVFFRTGEEYVCVDLLCEFLALLLGHNLVIIDVFTLGAHQQPLNVIFCALLSLVHPHRQLL